LSHDTVPPAVLDQLTAPRATIAGLDLARPLLMGVVNVTPDSFSDGGVHFGADRAIAHGVALAKQGARILDIGGESTRPGAETVPVAEECDRVLPVIRGLRAAGVSTPISIDTRKAEVAAAALGAGADIVNDVSALSYDADMISVLINSAAPVCVMHAQGDPKTMQANPVYDDVLLDVYDYLASRVAFAEGHGIDKSRIMVDPGIGFGKTKDHNLALIRGLSLFHGLGCPVLLGVSRKRFIGTIGDAPEARDRAPGSIAIGLEGFRQGVQILRVHDVDESRQAQALWQAIL